MSVRAFAPVLDFSEPDIPEEVEQEIPDNRIEPEEVERLVAEARAAAFEEGRKQGFGEGQLAERQSISNDLNDMVAGLNREIAAIREKEEVFFVNLESRTSRLMLALVHQLAKRLSEHEAKRLAEDVTRRAIDAVKSKHRITIRASEEFLTPLRAVLRLPTEEAAAEHRIDFQPRSNDDEAPLEVAWLTGKVTFDPYGFIGEIDEVFTETLNSLSGEEGLPSEFGDGS